MPYIWITIYFSSIQQTCAPFSGMKHNVPQCSLMADNQSLVSWLGQLSGFPSGLSCPSCPIMHAYMGLGKHGLTHWDPRSTRLANQLIDHWQVHKNLPPYLAYILWNCSGVDGNNLESILLITWRRQAAFQIQYGIFRWILTKWSRLNKMYQTPVKRSSWLGYFYFPLVPHICVGELGQHWFG